MVNYQKFNMDGRRWQDSAAKKDVVALVLRDTTVEIKVGAEYVPVPVVWPWLFQGREGQVLCLDCEAWYSPEDLHEKVLYQKWGAVRRQKCPEGHTVSSSESISPEIERRLQYSSRIAEYHADNKSRDNVCRG